LQRNLSIKEVSDFVGIEEDSITLAETDVTVLDGWVMDPISYAKVLRISPACLINRS